MNYIQSTTYEFFSNMGNNTTNLEKFGFKYGQSGAHAARSMMLEELRTLFSDTRRNATKEQYQSNIIEHNLLDKPTTKSRSLTFRHLVDLYGLSNSIAIFRVFRKLWSLERDAQPVLALQMALVRDPLLRLSIPMILNTNLGDPVFRTDVEDLLKAQDPDRFSPASLKSFAQNINGSWTQAGYLKGRNKKQRAQPKITPVNVAFALFLAYFEGATGERLLHSSWCKLLELTEHQLVELSIAASHRGIIDFKQSGGITDVQFSGFLTVKEEQWRYE